MFKPIGRAVDYYTPEAKDYCGYCGKLVDKYIYHLDRMTHKKMILCVACSECGNG